MFTYVFQDGWDRYVLLFLRLDVAVYNRWSSQGNAQCWYLPPTTGLNPRDLRLLEHLEV